MRKKILLCISLCMSFALTACSDETIDASVPIETTVYSEASTDPAPESGGQNSDPVLESSDPEQGGFVQDETVLAQIGLEKDDLSALDIQYATMGLECKALFAVPAPARGIDITETGFVISLSHNPGTPDVSYTHYLWFDRDGNELDHVGFDLNAADGRIPDRDYPEKGFFETTSINDGISRALYFRNGTLQKTVQLPKCRRSDFSPDDLKYLCIDEERKNLILYDFETESAAAVLPVGEFGYDGAWVLDFVRVVTPGLATVTLLEFDENTASEYHGEENLRTYLLEFPTLKILQQLPDGAELTALDDGNFLVTKQADKIRRVSRAKLEGGKLVETETDFTINETSQFFDRANIILSPDKKVALLRDWIDNQTTLRCRAVSTDDMQLLWECRVPGISNGLITGGYTLAAITDDAVLYMFGSDGFVDDNGKRPLYRIGVAKYVDK